MSSILIRPASSDDADGIAETHVRSWKSTYPGMVPQSYLDSLNFEDYQRLWKVRLSHNSGFLVCVAEREGRIVGFASAGAARQGDLGYTGELYALYVLPDSQSRGVGTRLFQSIAKELTIAKHKDLFVWVLKENPARHFYTRMGGLLLKEERRDVGGTPIFQLAYGWRDIGDLLVPAGTGS